MMPDSTTPLERPGVGRIRFSLGSLLLLIAVVGLAISLVMTYRKLDRMERQLSAMQPMSPQEVARQFEQRTALGPVRTTVEDVRYSEKEDAYKVSFSWPDPKTGQKWSTEVRLKADGFGAYFGEIQSSEYIQLTGLKTTSFGVAVQTPSPLTSR